MRNVRETEDAIIPGLYLDPFVRRSSHGSGLRHGDFVFIRKTFFPIATRFTWIRGVARRKTQKEANLRRRRCSGE